MPPKVKITKEDIINAAVSIVRKDGVQSLNARTIASTLECSTQPIFSNFATMEDLRLAVVEKVDVLCGEYTKQEIASGEYPEYKANGMAYIRFAKEEKELFKLLYMRDRTDEKENKLDIGSELEALVQKTTGLDSDRVKLFHLEMWAYVHGIAVMFATNFFDIEWELVSSMITDCYMGLRKQYGLE